MVTDQPAAGQRTASNSPNNFAVGVTVFAAVMMIMLGALQAIQGIVALFNDEFYVVGQEWIFSFDVTTWGWIHLLVGATVAVAGFFLFQGALWARLVGIAVAAVSVLVNFAWLPYYPIWSIVIIALGVLVIWALTAHGRDIAQ